MGKRKKIARYVLWAVGGLVLVMGLAAGTIYLYQDKIIQLFVAEANKHIKTKVAVEKIDVSLWEKFPQVAISLTNVEITEALPGSTAPLAKLQQIHSTFSLWDLLWGEYHIKEIYLENGEVRVKVLPNGEVNYRFYQSADTSQSGKLSFDLQGITLRKVHVLYEDAPAQQKYDVQAHLMNAALSLKEPVVNIGLTGNARVNTILVAGDEYLQQKEITLGSQVIVNTTRKHVTIGSSELRIGKGQYQFGGTVNYAGKTQLDLNLEGKNTDIQSLVALLPRHVTKAFAQYQSEGDVYFKGIIKGEASAQKNPFIQVSFGCLRAFFFHPEYKEKLEQVSFAGSFTNGAQRNSQTSAVALRNIKGQLRGKPFSGEFGYKNFANPDVQAQLKADLDIAHVFGLFPVKDVKNGSGRALVNFSFAGNLKAFKTNPRGPGIKTSGEVQLQNVSLQFAQHPLPFKGVHGTFQVRKNDVAISDLKGKIGDTDFLVNGFLKNMLGYLFLDKQRLRVEADFTTRYLNLDQLLAASTTAPPVKRPSGKVDAYGYALNMPANLELDINAAVSSLKFRRFRAKQLKGNVLLKNQIISSPNIAMQVVGGRFKVQGSVDARQPLIKINSTAHIQDIKVDSLFYAFEDFGQAFITQRHLHGTLTAQINSELFFDHNLNARPDLMQAEIATTIRNGQLLNWAPMQKMSIFINRNELANLRFSEIKNNFYIQNRTIYIPEMEIKSSTSRFNNITLSGMHTFDQQMDYKLKIPLSGATKAKRDKDERFGVIATTTTASPNLFLTIKGREGNFKLAYDQERVKTKIAADLKTEKQELKELFQGKKKEEKKTVKPATEYFDF
ncbi:AsmA family protein [Nibribacter koreensis]